MTVGGPPLITSSRVRLTALLIAAGIAGVLLGTAIVAARPAPGLPDPGVVIEAGLPIVRVLLDLSGLITVGLCVLPLLIGADRPEPAEPVLARSRVWAAASSLVWATCTLVLLVLQTAQLHPGRNVSFAAIGSYISELGAGKALLVVIVSALVCTGLALRIGESLPAELRAAVSLLALLPLPVTGHAMDWRWHDLAMVSMELHVLGATAWTGGLFAVIALVAGNRALLADVLPRFSKLATVCLVVVAATGLVNGIAEVVLTPPGRDLISGLFGTGYGRLVAGKVLCLLGLAALGGNIRFRLLPAIIQRKPTALLRWAALELTVMGVAFGFAVVLTHAPVA
ncbi:copper resistance D family protein [Amycolatopsis sp. NPDC059021]|uniref:copper resistance D family protein n=1 Tax=Amycolatopsis sp. NPDC059021 TaxID=3346704 RepID=UPI003672CD1A